MIPIIINNFNRLSTTKKLVDSLFCLNYKNITIIDNKSTYEPLLNWYNTNPCKVIRLNENMGSRALWASGLINEFHSYQWIVYTDSDIEINPNTTITFVYDMIAKANQYSVNKVGLSLKIDDLPNNKYANTYRDWETQFWKTPLDENTYKADVDTTFAIIKPNLPFQYESIRMAGKYTAKHIPWYTDFKNLTEEEKYYLDNSNESSTYKQFYETNKNQINEQVGCY